MSRAARQRRRKSLDRSAGSRLPGPKPRRRLRVFAKLLGVGGAVAGTALVLFLIRPRPAVVIPADMDHLEPQLQAYIKGFMEAVRESPRAAERHATLGRVYAANHLWEEAAQCFEIAVELGHEGPLPAYYRAVAMSRLGGTDEAIARYRDVTLEFSDFAPAFHRLGDALLAKGDLDNAASAFERVIAIAPAEPDGYVGLGDVKLRQGHLAESARLLERAVRIRPNHTVAHYLLGLAYRDLGKVAEAERELRLGLGSEDVFMIDPWSDDITGHKKLLADQVALAFAHIEKGDFNTGLRILETAYTWYPKNVDVINDLAIAYLRSKRTKKAHELLQNALRIDESAFATRINLSACLLELGRIDEALEQADYAIRLSSTTAQAHIQRGSCLIRLQRLSEAIADFDAAIRYDSRNPGLHLQRALLCKALKRYGDAEHAFQTAAELDPSMIRAHLGLCEVCMLLQQPDEAARAFEAARRLSPEDNRVLAMAKRLGM